MFKYVTNYCNRLGIIPLRNKFIEILPLYNYLPYLGGVWVQPLL